MLIHCMAMYLVYLECIPATKMEIFQNHVVLKGLYRQQIKITLTESI